jgi:tetratricopeptide (TPR) repeat protein
LGHYEQALNDITQAMMNAGPNARDLSNMALADYNLGRYADSVEAARRALRLDSNYGPAHYVLGATLAMDRRTMAESVPHLELAARSIASAKAILMIVQKALSRN